MKRGITLILVVLFLTFRQGEPFIQIGDHLADRLIIAEAGFIYAESGLGFIKDNDRTDPFDLMDGVPVYLNNEKALNQNVVETNIDLTFHFHPNLLLLDKPPPRMAV